MLEHYLRPRMEPLFFHPLAKLVGRTKAAPTLITLFSLALGIAVIPFMLFRLPLAAVGMLWLSGLADVVDGSLARLSNRTTPFGTILDIVSDRIVEFSVVLALFLIDPNRAFVCLMMLGSILVCVTSFLVCGIVSEKTGQKSFYYNPGLIERAEAFIFFTLMILFPKAFYFWGWTFVFFVFLTALLHIGYSTVTDLARLRGWSISQPRSRAE